MKSLLVVVLLFAIICIGNNSLMGGWTVMESGTTENLNAVWVGSATDVFAVGNNGSILHYDGLSWTTMSSTILVDLHGVWGSSGGHVFAVGDGGTIISYNGVEWLPMDSGTTEMLKSIWGSSATDIFVISGEGTILHYDGYSWSPMESGIAASHSFVDIWGGSGTDVYILSRVFVGFGENCIHHYNGVEWSIGGCECCGCRDARYETPFGIWGNNVTGVFTVEAFGNFWCTGALMYHGCIALIDNYSVCGFPFLYAVWGTTATDVFTIGSQGAIYHYDGESLFRMSSGLTNASLYDVGGSSHSVIFAVGSTGTILYYDGDYDSDGLPDDGDNCIDDYNPLQIDCDHDGAGDICDPDTIDPDADGISYACDNCPNTPNPLQEDSYPPQGNSCGDACDCEGNFNSSEDQDVDGTDAALLKMDFGRGGFNFPCIAGNPCKGDFSCDGDVDGSDAALFKSDFGRSPFQNPCPSCVVTDWCNY